MFYLTTHSTYFIYGYMASDIWLRTILIVRKETRCRHIGYSYRLTARVLLYAPSHRQDNTYHGLLLHQSWSTGWNEKTPTQQQHTAHINKTNIFDLLIFYLFCNKILKLSMIHVIYYVIYATIRTIFILQICYLYYK